MKALFNAMESLEIKDDKSLEVLETEMSAMQAEYDAAVREMDTMEAESDELEEAVEQINQLTAIITEHGLSKAMVAAIEAIEPNFSSYNLFPALENLNELPTKDAQSELAIEGIKDMAKKAKDVVVKLFKMIVEKMQEIGRWILKIFNKRTEAFRKYFSKIKKTESREKIKPVDKIVEDKLIKTIKIPGDESKHVTIITDAFGIILEASDLIKSMVSSIELIDKFKEATAKFDEKMATLNSDRYVKIIGKLITITDTSIDKLEDAKLNLYNDKIESFKGIFKSNIPSTIKQISSIVKSYEPVLANRIGSIHTKPHVLIIIDRIKDINKTTNRCSKTFDKYTKHCLNITKQLSKQKEELHVK